MTGLPSLDIFAYWAGAVAVFEAAQMVSLVQLAAVQSGVTRQAPPSLERLALRLMLSSFRGASKLIQHKALCSGILPCLSLLLSGCFAGVLFARAKMAG